MTRNLLLCGVTAAATALSACADASRLTAPSASGDLLTQASVENGEPGRRIFLRDQCGGDSWAGFGGCLISGTVERPDWLERVLTTGSHPLWANSPVRTSVRDGTTLEVVNVGGRPHSFTRVANFGGGILPLLNTREDTRVPAPECLSGILQIPGGGAAIMHTFEGEGEHRYQCCYHPWMRTTVDVKPAHSH